MSPLLLSFSPHPLASRPSSPAAKPKLATFAKYARVELVPPSPTELPEVARGFGNLLRAARQRKYRDMTVKECWISTLVAVEVMCWFWVGECIGKGTIVGYQG